MKTTSIDFVFSPDLAQEVLQILSDTPQLEQERAALLACDKRDPLEWVSSFKASSDSGDVAQAKLVVPQESFLSLKNPEPSGGSSGMSSTPQMLQVRQALNNTARLFMRCPPVAVTQKLFDAAYNADYARIAAECAAKDYFSEYQALTDARDIWLSEDPTVGFTRVGSSGRFPAFFDGLAKLKVLTIYGPHKNCDFSPLRNLKNLKCLRLRDEARDLETEKLVQKIFPEFEKIDCEVTSSGDHLVSFCVKGFKPPAT